MNELTIPTSADEVTNIHIEQAYARYEAVARRYLTGTDDLVEQLEVFATIFESPAEQEVAIAQQVIIAVDAVDTVGDCVKQLAFQVLSRHEQSYDSWDGVVTAAVTAIGQLSESGKSEHRTLAQRVAPFCQRHGIEIDIQPGKFGLLREAASKLGYVVNDPRITIEDKIIEITRILELVATGTRADVRADVRQPRGEAAWGAETKLDDERILVLRGTPAAIAAVKQRAGNLVKWRRQTTVATQRTTAWEASKLDDGSQTRVCTLTIEADIKMEVLTPDGVIEEILV